MLSSSYLLIYKTKDGNADLHAQVMQTKDGRLQQEEAGNEEQAEAQGQEVPLTPFCGINWVKRGNDPTQKLRLHSLRCLLHQETYFIYYYINNYFSFPVLLGSGLCGVQVRVSNHFCRLSYLEFLI